MNKRLICALLTLVLLFSLIPSVSFVAKAESNLKTSDALIDLLIAFEGFTGKCIVDGSQRSVGYGTRCDVCTPGMDGYLNPNRECTAYNDRTPISREHAMELKRGYLNQFESQVNSFLNKHGVTFNQQQFDALISFTYNCGGGWTYETTGNMYNAIASGDTGARVAYAMGLYKTAGGNKVSIGHVRRRMLELQVFFYGVYDVNRNWPDKVRYVYLDGNGGTVPYGIQAFDINHPTEILEKITAPSGYQFAGWFTKPEGGTEIRQLNESITNGQVLYAQWRNSAGEIVTVPGSQSAFQSADVNVVVSGNSVQLYEGPATYFATVRKAANGEQLHIQKTTTDQGGVLWGMCSDGWVQLSSTNYNSAISGGSGQTGTWYQVTTSGGVNVRTGPSTSYPTVSAEFKYQGTLVQIVETQTEGNNLWGKLPTGNWMCMRYNGADYVKESTASGGSATGKTVSSVAIETAPSRNEYSMDDKWVIPDLRGGTMRITYSDNSSQVVDITRNMISGYSNTSVGSKTVTVTVGGKSATFSVYIRESDYVEPDKYLVTFKNYDGTVISREQYTLGSAVIVPAQPSRPNDNKGQYVFVGWDKEITACQGAAEYTALFELKYPVGDIDCNSGINEDDAIYLLRHVIFPEKYSIACVPDFDSDGAVNSDDAVYLLRHVIFPDKYPLSIS